MIPFEFRLPPYDHQNTALEFTAARDFYALLMEQGTGKTPVVIWDTARRYLSGALDGLFVLAPNGVQSNWILREIPRHMPEVVFGSRLRAAAFTSNMNKRDAAAVQGMLQPGPEFRILTMNWEALNTADGFEVATEFLSSMPTTKAALAGDESQRIKNPSAKRTKAVTKLKPLAQALRVIMSGTPVVKSPWDAYSQFGLLSRNILQTPSYVAFKAEYAVLLPPGHGLLRHIAQRIRPEIEKRYEAIRTAATKEQEQAAEAQAAAEQTADPEGKEKILQRVAQLLEHAKLELNRFETLVHEELEKRSPQLVARDPITGLPMWRNLEKLDQLIAPHSFRVLKKDCLDLPEKVYTERFFTMTPKQRIVHDRLREELRLELANGDIAPVHRLASLTKLSQVVSGYFIVPGTKDVRERIMPLERNPKISILLEELQSCLAAGEQVIVWARFQFELQDIARVLEEQGREAEGLDWTFAEYHGEIGSKHARQQAIDDFESGKAKIFLSQQQAGGTGLTLIAANSIASSMTVLYYTNTFSLEDRLQSEDRAHRIGQTKRVRYVDITCADSEIDQAVRNSLKNKIDIAAVVTGDARRAAEAVGLSK